MVAWLRKVIGTPVECLRVNSEAALIDKARKIQAGYGFPPRLVETGEKRSVHVSDGRWVLDCDCGNGCLAHPGGSEGWPRPIAVCTECGNVYQAVFPKDREKIEAALLARPSPLNRHFFPHAADAAKRGLSRAETLADLQRENDQHGPRAPGKGR